MRVLYNKVDWNYQLFFFSAIKSTRPYNISKEDAFFIIGLNIIVCDFQHYWFFSLEYGLSIEDLLCVKILILNCVILIKIFFGHKRILFTDENEIMVTVNKAGIKALNVLEQWVGSLGC